ncbi:MAG: GNAT family N-acetyltransferase [Chloroflexi bacterium]|nr:GNAT family N-acetyltransferase [Chloroflexota bacterium]
MKIHLNNRPILHDLGDGLILCRSMADDAEALAEFNSRIHSDDGFDKPDLRVEAWTHDLLARPHPIFHADDFTLVVEAATGKIVSSMNLISQTWAYEGIPFGVGRPELVGTLPEYRKRGLVRLQFEEVHKWSAERGELVQGITGIPFYYRLFGYEMGLELGGGRTGYEAQLPKLKDGESEAFTIRPAAEADIPFLMEVYAHACQRRLVTCVRDEALWRYDLTGQSGKNAERLEFRILERAGTKEPAGYFTHPWYDWDTGLVANHYELKPGVSWLEATPSVARYLWQTGETCSKWNGKPEVRTTYGFWFGSEHPSYDIFRERLPRLRDPYAWYMRVPDLPAFLRLIAPALEHHIAGSAIVGYTGETRISFYRSGLRLVLEKGKLTAIEPWIPCNEDRGNAAFPDLSFLQLVFGYRTFEELEQSYADCTYKDDETRVLLSTLFPKKASSVMFVN